MNQCRRCLQNSPGYTRSVKYTPGSRPRGQTNTQTLLLKDSIGLGADSVKMVEIVKERKSKLVYQLKKIKIRRQNNTNSALTMCLVLGVGQKNFHSVQLFNQNLHVLPFHGIGLIIGIVIENKSHQQSLLNRIISLKIMLSFAIIFYRKYLFVELW